MKQIGKQLTMTKKIIHYYRKTEPSHSLFPSALEELKTSGFVKDSEKILSVETESCFNVGLSRELATVEQERLEWLLAETFEPDKLRLENSSLVSGAENKWLIEFGPRLSFTSAFSSNAVSICQACDIGVTRLELSRRYRFILRDALSDGAIDALRSFLHDRMTEEEYKEPLQSFLDGTEAAPVKIIPIMKEGRKALERLNEERGLGFDDHDLDYYTELFKVSYCSMLNIAARY